MNLVSRYTKIVVALLFWGSAILLISCKEKISESVVNKRVMTQQSDSMTMVVSEKGQRKYKFESPLIESYELMDDPYMEFRQGIRMTTYDDSTQLVVTTLVADYAIFYTKQELWEAKGNVVAVNAKGEVLKTEQLFWNIKQSVIYSNVDSEVTDQKGTVLQGVGFESDEEFVLWHVRKVEFEGLIDSTIPTNSDTTKVDSVALSGSRDMDVAPTPKIDSTLVRQKRFDIRNIK